MCSHALVHRSLWFAAASTLVTSAGAQCPDQVAKLQYALPSSGSQFGDSVAMDGDVIVVGDPFAKTTLNSTGVAHVYERVPTGAAAGYYVLTADLQAPAPQFDARFGWSVSVSGDRILVGSPRHDPQFGWVNRGGAFLFTRNATGNWVYDRTFEASNGVNNDEFGTAVDISGNDIVVGAPQPLGAGPGIAYVYHFYAPPGVGWVETQVINPNGFTPGVGPTTLYGCAVAIDGNYMVVGQRAYGSTAFGRAEIFRRSSSSSTLPYFLMSLTYAPTPQSNEQFGMAVDIDDATKTAIIGAWTSVPVPFRGSAYVYTEAPGVWSFQQQLLASNGGQQHHFGWSVAIEDDTALVGAWGNHSAYEFRRSGSTWSQSQILDAAPATSGDSFGYDVELSGHWAVVGAPGTPVADQAAYVFGSVGGLGANYGPLTPNTAGPGAVMAANGSASLAANSLVLQVSGCPANKTGMFLCGPSQAQTPLYDGNLLVSPGLRIQPLVTTNGAGAASLAVDLTAPVFVNLALTAGDVLNFQFWYRDSTAQGANLSDALRIRFCN